MTDEPNEAPEGDNGADALFGEDPKPARKTRQAKAVVEEERLHPVLSNEDFRRAQEAARTTIDKERRLAAMNAVKADEVARIRREEGLTTADDRMDEQVHIMMDLPLWSPYIKVNNFPYWHSVGYDVPRHVYDTLMEQMFRAWKHDDQIDGKSIRETMIRQHRHAPNTLDGNTGASLHTERYDA